MPATYNITRTQPPTSPTPLTIRQKQLGRSANLGWNPSNPIFSICRPDEVGSDFNAWSLKPRLELQATSKNAQRGPIAHKRRQNTQNKAAQDAPGLPNHAKMERSWKQNPTSMDNSVENGENREKSKTTNRISPFIKTRGGSFWSNPFS